MTARRAIVGTVRAALFAAKWLLFLVALYVWWPVVLTSLVGVALIKIIPRGPYAKMDS